MGHLHWEFHASGRAAIEVTLDKQANVLLLDSVNYANYRSWRQFRYHGGLAKQSPVWLHPPHAGRWHVVVDPVGGRVRASARLIQ